MGNNQDPAQPKINTEKNFFNLKKERTEGMKTERNTQLFWGGKGYTARGILVS